MLVAFLLCVDAFVVAALALARPPGFLAPLIAFSLILAGLIGLEAWAIRHRRDEPPLS